MFRFLRLMRFTISFVVLVLLISMLFLACENRNCNCDKSSSKDSSNKLVSKVPYIAPDTSSIPDDEFGDAVRYGRKLIVHTAYYLGPEGKVGKYLGNKMNCQNCHLEAGTKPYAFNFLSTHARYPQYRARENKILSLAERVNNCIERPHNGLPLPLDCREMTAIVCYIKWLGNDVPIDSNVPGDSPIDFEYPDKASDPVNGEKIYKNQCASCHGKDGEGKMRMDNICYEYPPLWGMKSYQPGSSLHRVVKAAKFIYANMPNTINWKSPKLTVSEAMDVAAFINNDTIHKRPRSKGSDYPLTIHKPIDYGKGPYIDTFPEIQHKFGPYKPIIEFRKMKKLPVKF